MLANPTAPFFHFAMHGDNEVQAPARRPVKDRRQERRRTCLDTKAALDLNLLDSQAYETSWTDVCVQRYTNPEESFVLEH